MAGQCYKDAYEALMRNHDDAVLVHGIVTGQGSIKGIRYGHAWVERYHGCVVEDQTVDGPNKLFLKDEYYCLGKITDVRKYTWKEAMEHALKTETYGPWDKVFLQDGIAYSNK